MSEAEIKWESVNEEDTLKLYNELGMTKSSIQRDITYIKQWLKQQPHLPDLKDDNETNKWLELMLFHCKNRLEKVKTTIEMHYIAKAAAPELCCNRDPTSAAMRKNLQNMYILIFPKLTPDKYRVLYFGRKYADVENFDSIIFMRSIIMSADIFMKEEINNGIIVIFDFNNSNLALWSKYNFNTLRKFLTILQKAYPARVKSVFVLHATSYFRTLLPFLPEKIKKRLHIHTGDDFTGLHNEVPKDCLPGELGGTMGDMLDELNVNWWSRVERHKQWFSEQDEIKLNVELLKKKSAEKSELGEMFALDGSFRTLVID